MAKRLKKRDPMQLFSEKGDFTNKKRPKRDPKSGLGLLRDLGPPKRDPVGSSVHPTLYFNGVCMVQKKEILSNVKAVELSRDN